MIESFGHELSCQVYTRDYTNGQQGEYHVFVGWLEQSAMVRHDSFYNSNGITDGWLTEEYPCYGDKSECKEYPTNTHWQICRVDFLLTKHFLNDLEYAMENTPEYKSPICAMPNTTYQECHEDVPVISRLGASAST